MAGSKLLLYIMQEHGFHQHDPGPIADESLHKGTAVAQRIVPP
jgi:hypothetical protein